MKKKISYLILVLVLFSVCFGGCVPAKETPFLENSETLTKEVLNQVIEATVLICFGDQNHKQVIGRGTVVGERYILTAGHVVSDPIQQQGDYYLLIKEKYYGSVKPIFVSSASIDFALIEIPKDISLPSLKIGNSDNLKPGALIYYIGFQNKIEEKILKKGTAAFITSSSLEFSAKQSFLHGESGAPVFIIENGQPVMIGIFQATSRDGDKGLAVLVNLVISTLEKEAGISLRD